MGIGDLRNVSSMRRMWPAAAAGRGRAQRVRQRARGTGLSLERPACRPELQRAWAGLRGPEAAALTLDAVGLPQGQALRRHLDLAQDPAVPNQLQRRRGARVVAQVPHAAACRHRRLTGRPQAGLCSLPTPGEGALKHPPGLPHLQRPAVGAPGARGPRVRPPAPPPASRRPPRRGGQTRGSWRCSRGLEGGVRGRWQAGQLASHACVCRPLPAY